MTRQEVEESCSTIFTELDDDGNDDNDIRFCPTITGNYGTFVYIVVSSISQALKFDKEHVGTYNNLLHIYLVGGGYSFASRFMSRRIPGNPLLHLAGNTGSLTH